MGGAGLHQPAVRARCRGVVLETLPGADGRPDHGSDRVLEIGDRNRSLEDADAVVVPGVFSFGEDTVCGAAGE